MSLVALVLLPLLVSPALSIPFGYGSTLDYGYDYLNGYDYADFYGYPRTVDYARENFVRGTTVGTSEVGIRDQVTYRPNGFRPPYSRFYSTYLPFSYSRGYNRYPYDYVGNFPFRQSVGFYQPRPYIERYAGDTLYLK